MISHRFRCGAWTAVALAPGFAMICGTPVKALDAGTVQASRDQIGASRLSQQLINLITFTTLPGVSGGNFTVSRDGPEPDYEIVKLTVGGRDTIAIEQAPFDLYLEGGLGFLQTDENSFGIGAVDDIVVAAKTDRTIYSGRIGVGLSFPLGSRFHLTPVFNFALSRFENDTGLGAVVGNGGGITIVDLLTLDWTAWAATYAATLQLRYEESFGEQTLEAEATYSHAYTDVFAAPTRNLRVSGSNDVVTLFGRWSAPTEWTVYGQPLRWNVFSSATVLTGDGRDALGFSYFVELGAGLDLDLRDKDLWLIEGIRPRVSGIIGDNVIGWLLALSIRF